MGLGEGHGSEYPMGTEFQFCKMKTVSMCLGLPNCPPRHGYDGKFCCMGIFAIKLCKWVGKSKQILTASSNKTKFSCCVT